MRRKGDQEELVGGKGGGNTEGAQNKRFWRDSIFFSEIAIEVEGKPGNFCNL